MRARFAAVLSAAVLSLFTGVLPDATLATHPEASLDVACARNSDGVLRYVIDASDCAATETAVSIRPGPTNICLAPDGAANTPDDEPDEPQLPDTALPAPPGFFDIPRVTSGACAPGESTLTLPSATDAYFCVADGTDLLRYVDDPSECTSTETPVVAANHSPTAMGLSGGSVAEGEPAGTVVGSLSTTDEDLAESFTYSLASGAGDDDNPLFAIVGSTLVTAAVLDFEATTLAITAAGSRFAPAGIGFEAALLDVAGAGSLSVRVQVTDAVGATLEATFSITITDVNEAPTNITLTPSAVVENSPIGTTVGTLDAIDEDIGQVHMFDLVAGIGDTDNASFTIAGDQLQLAASLPIGTYSIRVEADDGAGGLFARALTITVTDVNDAPTDITLTGDTVAENEPATTPIGTLAATDPDVPPQTFTFTLASTGCGGGPFSDNAAFAIVGNELRTATVLDFEAQSSFLICIRATDSGTPALSFDESFSITVSDVNDPPSFALPADPDQAILEDAGPQTVAGLSTLISAGGEIGQTLSFTVDASDPTLFSVQPDIDETTGDLTYTTAADANGTATVSVTLSDDGGGSTDTSPTQTFDIAVAAVNDAPSFSLPASPDQTIPQDAGPQTAAGFATAIFEGPLDEAGQALSFGLTTTNDALFSVLPAIDASTGDLTYTAAAGTSGSATVSVVLTDDGGTANGGDNTSSTQTFDITVVPPNELPVAVGEDVITTEDTPLLITLTGTDADDENLSFSIADLPTEGILGPTAAPDCSATDTCTTTATYTPDPNFFGTDSFTFTVNDGTADSNIGTITITVTPVNDAPVLALSGSTPSYTENGSPVTVDGGLSVTDIDSADLVSGSVTISAGSVAGDTLTFTPAGGITDTDLAADVLALSGTTSAVNWQTVLRSVQFSSTSDNPSNATRTVSFTVNDGTLSSNTVQQTVAVVPVNDAPVLTQPDVGTLTYTENDPATVIAPNIAAADVDSANLVGATIDIGTGYVNGEDALNLGTNPQNGITAAAFDATTGTLTLSGTSSVANYQTALRDVRFANPSDDPTGGVRTITFQVDDGTDASNVVSRNVEVVPVNDAPLADDESFGGTDAAVGNTTLIGNDPTDGAPALLSPRKTITADLLSGDTDAEGQALVVVPVTDQATNDGGLVTIEADGDFVYTPAPGTSCTDTSDFFTYTVSDQNATGPGPTPGTDTGQVTIAISGCVWYVSNNAAGNSGTSTAPFDTLAQAETASGANHTVFVFDGDNTSTGYGGDGYAMNAGERLIGEHEGLVVGADTLFAASPGARPTLTASNADVISIDDGNEIRGLVIDPQGTGGGIAGGAGDTGGGTIDDVSITDTGTIGTQPGLELDATAGTFTISNLSVATSGATGVRLNNAGTVNFLAAGSITISAGGAPGLDATGTNMGSSTFDAIAVAASADGGVSLTNTTGATTFGGLSVTTTAGAAPAFLLSTAGTVTVDAADTATLGAVGGPAVDVTGTPGATLSFDSVSSTASATDGINIAGLGAGTFSAASGTITGATGIAFDLDGGSGAVTVGASLTASGAAARSVEVTNRTGGTVDINGLVTDTATGINLSTNGAGLVRFDGGVIASTGGNTAFSATVSGSVAVTDTNGTTVPNNTLTTTTGTALNVANQTIHAEGVNFQSISANGAVSGISLSNTGTQGSLTVTGVGSTAQGGDNSGGTIQNTTSHGISLTNTTGPSFRNLRLLNTGDSGVNGTQVIGFTFMDSTITGAGDASDENSITFDDSLTGTPNLTGVVTITNNVISQTEAEGIDIENWAGTISVATISNNALSDTGDVATPGSAITLIGSGLPASAANITRATISNNTITDFRAGVGIQVRAGNPNVGGPTGSAGTAGSATNVIAITGNLMNGGNGGIGNQPDRFFTGGVSGNGGQGNFNISGNGTAAIRLQHIDCIAIEVQMDGPVTMTSTVSNNFINANSAVGCAGIAVGTDDPLDLGAGAHTTTISGNNVMGTDGPGIFPIVRDSGSTMIAKVLNNTVAAPNATNAARAGIRVDSGSAAGDTTLCLEISGNVTAGSTNSATSTTSPGINLRKQGTDTTINTFGIEGLAPSPTGTPNVENFVNGLNTSTSGTFGVGGTALLSAQTGFTSCTAP